MSPDFVSQISSALRYQSYSDLVENLYLTSIVDSFVRLNSINDIGQLTENEIRNYLAFDLENHNEILRPFLESKVIKMTKENTLLLSPTTTKRTDIEFFASFFGDFVVECKRLSSADQRYIDEGVDRFVNMFYAKTDEEAGMIGFVVGSKIDKIKNSISDKVKKTSSFDSGYSDHRLNCCNHAYSFHTRHERSDKSKIILHHLFTDLS